MIGAGSAPGLGRPPGGLFSFGGQIAGGYGLGLSIAKGIVLAHRGKIRAESSGASLSVIVSLPV